MGGDGLNRSQREAVDRTEGPLLVLAGAGSGKTRVVTHRMANLLDQGVAPEQILGLTFTNKAAEEMRERLHAMVGSTAKDVVLSTFHSLGVRILREEPKTFGLPAARFSILDQGDTYGIVRSLLREHGHHGNPAARRFDLGAVVQRISLWKGRLLDPERAQDKGASDEYDEVALSLYPAYQERLRNLGAVDFDDLVSRIAMQLRDDEDTRKRWSGRFSHLLVDEYQDTNHAQLELLRQLVSEHGNLCVVGDDDQAIYGWRGAKVANILGFDMLFPGTHIVRLEENYRSRSPILAAANAVIRENTRRHEKTLKPTRQGGEPVAEVIARDGEHEANWVGKQIYELVKRKDVPGDQIAVLYRSALQGRAIEERLKEHGLEYRVVGGQSFYDKREVKDATAYLKLLVMPRDELAVRRALETPPRGIGSRSLERVLAFGQSHSIGLLDAVLRVNEVEGIASGPRRALDGFATMVRDARTRMRSDGSAVGALSGMLDHVGMRDAITKEAGSESSARTRWDGVKWLMDGVKRFEDRAHGTGKRPRYAEHLGSLTLDPRADEDEQKSARGQVTLATLHSSKGLEWDYVFVIGCEEGTIPHRRVDAPRQSDAIAGDVEEERRLFYVGMTRARERLWLTRCTARVERGREVQRVPSRFLEQLPDDVQRYEIAEQEEVTAESVQEMADAFLARLDARD